MNKKVTRNSMSNRLGIYERFKINIKLERLIVEKAFKSFAQLLLVYLFFVFVLLSWKNST